MSDMLLLIERIKNTIQLGESHFREFKSAFEGAPNSKKPRPAKKVCEDIAEALVAFANADGGELLIGVEDNGRITGMPHSKTDIDMMLHAPKTHTYPGTTLPLIASQEIVINNLPILFFSVSKGTTEVYQLSDGRCVARKDKYTMPMPLQLIIFDRQEVKSREFDRAFVDGATVNDLDKDFVQTMANDYLRGLSVERYLQQIGLAEYAANGLRLRRAALLLFAKSIQRWSLLSQVRILKIAGTELKSGEQYNVQSDELVQGNIFELLINSWEKLRPFLAYKTEFGSNAKFEQKFIYPEAACREALVNAIAHRDYSLHKGIDVYIFDDRIEIRSPGSLLSTITIEGLTKLQGLHESRNVLVAKVLRENNYMRELGEGIKRIFEVMEANEFQKPKLETDTTTFNITLSHKSVFNRRQEEWLLLFSNFQLSPLQKKIVVFGMDERIISPAEIYKAMNNNDRDTYDREVTGLRNAGILVTVRTSANATQYANARGMQKRDVPRFKVTIPKDKKR